MWCGWSGARSSARALFPSRARHQFYDSVLNEISDALARGESVKISSFGSFLVRMKGERIGRNPKTGEEVPIKPRRVLVFRSSHVLKDRVNKGAGVAS